jgi:hypothetical protein
LFSGETGRLVANPTSRHKQLPWEREKVTGVLRNIFSIPALSADIQDTFQGLVLIVVILIQTVGPALREKRTFSRRPKAGVGEQE